MKRLFTPKLGRVSLGKTVKLKLRRKSTVEKTVYIH